MRRACATIAPVWPLDSFVAVNPYLGLADQDFTEAAARLDRVGGVRTTMPASFYLEAFDQGRMTRADLADALEEQASRLGHFEPENVEAFLLCARQQAESSPVSASPDVETVADVARTVTGEAWDRFATDRVSAWASAHFDQGQAPWRVEDGTVSLYESWRVEAVIDRSPEVAGLSGFRTVVATLPREPLAAASRALERLGVPSSVLDGYLHRLLIRCGGWAAFAARIDFERSVREQEPEELLLDFLSILIVWEYALLETLDGPRIRQSWNIARGRLASAVDTVKPRADLDRELVLQAAYERSEQRRLVAAFRGSRRDVEAGRPDVQAVFCIDVRSEPFRRHLEATGDGVETLGFAGFFGFGVDYTRLGHDTAGAHCPVLIPPAFATRETIADPAREDAALKRRRVGHEFDRAWNAFKSGAVSCFSFVSPLGLAYLPKLLTDAFGVTRPVAHPRSEGLGRRGSQALRPDVVDALTLAEAIPIAEGALRGMSLTDGFARIVLFAGHGSTSVNNPHATGLDCGACGGRTGEPNARIACETLNDARVRAGLAERGIDIPVDTVFVPGVHDTTTDDLTLYDLDNVPESHAADVARLQERLAEAGRGTRSERAARLLPEGARSHHEAIRFRGKDWAQTRPEWGLAGCSALVVAPRSRTAGVDLAGRSFLHSYDWKEDDGFGVLELIMTAPLVVASWINLQYYASTVDNEVFGSGNKTLHNVVGRVGVLEGHGGDLRVGLPWQSLHDGERLQHDPIRLNVVIEAPVDAMNEVLLRHENVRTLLDHGWVHLFRMDDEGQIAQRYSGALHWEDVVSGAITAPRGAKGAAVETSAGSDGGMRDLATAETERKPELVSAH